ncbi:MAG TPA: pilus assembly protein PilN [Gammaproteobacteria bacterium]|nr:pilus assembly protein PilN [Gammaproteobacteria bacterium]HAU06429.1 pilus assembly protein PilN [Gammaproteobacteria bacterium]
MTRINLLPWRDQLREERKKRLTITIIVAAILAVVMLYLTILFIDDKIKVQAERNQYLTTEIAVLDQKLTNIKRLESEKEQLMTKMNIVHSLQSSRYQVVKILDAFARIVPEGVKLTRMSRKEEQIIIEGIAQSNARVSVFMRQIEEHPIFDESDLQVIQREEEQKKFILQVVEAVPLIKDNVQN